MTRPTSVYQDIRLYTFLGIIVFLFLHHVYGYFGHYGYDDIMGYAYYAKKWADGQLFYLNDDFFSYRWGFISLTAFFYALFGMGDMVSAIAPTLICLATVLLIFKVTDSFRPEVGAIAAGIYIVDNWTLFYADKIMPDTTVAFWAFASFAVIHQVKFKDWSMLKSGFLLAACLLMGYMTKQTILLLLPAFGGLFLWHMYKGKQRLFWISTTVSSILLGIAYLGFIYYLTGDPLMRFRVAEAGHAANLGRSFAFCNYAAQSVWVVLDRISLGFVKMLLSSGLMLSVSLAIAAIIVVHRSRVEQGEEIKYWGYVLILALLSANFMTTSYKAYQPMCLDVRHFLFLVPIAAVTAASSLYRLFTQKDGYLFYVGVSISVAALAWGLIGGNMRWAYLGVMGSMLLWSISPKERLITLLCVGAFSVSMLAASVSNILESRKNGYEHQRLILYHYFKAQPHRSVIVTDPIQRNFGLYLLEFDNNKQTTFYTFDQLDTIALPPNVPIYVLQNGYTQYMSHVKYETLPKCIRATQAGRRPPEVEQLYRKEGVVLYRVHDYRLLKE